jgi:signal transduction histidine kinase
VTDGGRGIPEPERTAVLGRFVRGAGAAVAGSGLGLALVEQQVRLHGGALRIDDAPEGGCRVTVRLPRAVR